jgi:hypothetical protein
MTLNRVTECQKLAWDVATAKIPCKYHNLYGYQYYRDSVDKIAAISNSTPHLLVLRVEHLQQDWASIESMFNNSEQSNTTAVDFESKVNESPMFVAHDISKEGTRNLCQALCGEIQAYKDLLFRAKNLNKRQKEETMGELLKICPQETLEMRLCDYE